MVTCRGILEDFLFYQTPKIVIIKSFFVGALSRILQLILLLYIIGYACIYKRGYQEFSEVSSSVAVKVKGVVYTNFSNEELDPRLTNPEWYQRIWDEADYVIPALENGAVFIATHMIITANQTQGTCAERPNAKGASCEPNNNTCVPGKRLAHGVATGNCIIANDTSESYSCEINAWCPLEVPINPLRDKRYLLQGSENFTILIKNFIEFPKFSKSRRRNIKDDLGENYLKNCEYDSEHNPDCPIFRLGNIAKWSGHQDYNALAFQGGIIAVVINWDCDLDKNLSDCYPRYDFSRLDNPLAHIAPGWNFRMAVYYSEKRRSLFKVTGIRLTINVIGKAGKFSIMPLLINIGSGLGLLAVVPVICDLVALYVIQKKDFYKSKKFEEVLSQEAFSTNEVSKDQVESASAAAEKP